MDQQTWKRNLQQWQEFASRINARAKAAEVGVPYRIVKAS